MNALTRSLSKSNQPEPTEEEKKAAEDRAKLVARSLKYQNDLIAKHEGQEQWAKDHSTSLQEEPAKPAEPVEPPKKEEEPVVRRGGFRLPFGMTPRGLK